MSSIQEIHALEERIFAIVQDYVDGQYNEEDVFALSKRCGRVTLKADAPEKIKVGKTTEIYPLKDFVRLGDDGKPEPDYDKISNVANNWLFID